jgi:hypothetical protein
MQFSQGRRASSACRWCAPLLKVLRWTVAPGIFAPASPAHGLGGRPSTVDGPEKGVRIMFSEGALATILVCEEDEETLDLLCDQLTADRFEVLPAPSAADALRLCRYNHPDELALDP